MERYTIYCTEEQTKKALELGAPIEESPMVDIIRGKIGNRCLLCGSYVFWYPTAEQMCGWLREQGEHILVRDYSDAADVYWQVSHHPAMSYNCDYSSSYKKAVLTAIDVALAYLSRNKKEEE